jgi:multiple sugar transport system permease protein
MSNFQATPGKTGSPVQQILQPARAVPGPRRRQNFLQRATRPQYLLIMPAILVLGFITIYPFLQALHSSLFGVTIQNYFDAPFVGLQNYSATLQDPTFWSSLLVSLMYVVAVVTLEFLLGLGLALLLDRPLFGKRLIILLLIAPMFVAPVLIGYSYLLQLDPLIGPIPYWLSTYLHFTFNNEGPLGPTYALPTVILVDVWQWTPFMFILLYAGLQTMPHEVLEAARVDGAHRFRLLYHIILPLIRPVIAIAVVFRTVDAFRVFDSIHVLTDGGPENATTTISVFIDHTAFLAGNFGEAASISVMLIIVVTIVARLLVRLLFGQQISATR